MEISDLKPGQTVLDIGTGTGAVALIAARDVGKTGSVVGIDPAEKMLALARKKAGKLDLNLRLERMDAINLGFPGNSFDRIIANLAFPGHFFFQSASEAFRVLKPGGILCFSESVGASASGSAIFRIFQKYKLKHVSQKLETRRRAKLKMQELDKRFPISKWQRILRKAGFEDIHVIRDSFPFKHGKVNDYLEYFVAREQPEYDALTKESRKAFVSECRWELGIALNTKTRMRTRALYKFYVAKKPRSEYLPTSSNTNFGRKNYDAAEQG